MNSRNEARDASNARILDAARMLFAERGYGRASIREIAELAAVDAAIVIRRFGSKDRLFLRTMELDPRSNPILEGDLDDLGARLVTSVLHRTDGFPRAAYRALIGAADRAEVSSYLQAVTESRLIAPLASRLNGHDAHLRATVIAAQITGLLDALWRAENPELTAASVEQLAGVAGAGIQALIDINSSSGSEHPVTETTGAGSAR